MLVQASCPHPHGEKPRRPQWPAGVAAPAWRTGFVKLRCTLDGLLLHAEIPPGESALVAFDGAEPFVMERVEALYYELVSATPEELLHLERARYRLLRKALDFEFAVD
jgi:hypothetical protein